MHGNLRDDVGDEAVEDVDVDVLNQRAENDLHLHRRELLAQAHTRPRGKRHEGAPRKPALELAGPPLRPKLLGVVEILLVLPERERADREDRALGEEVVPQAEVLRSLPSKNPHRRQAAKRFLDAHVEVGKVVEIVDAHRPVPHRAIDLFPSLCDFVLVACQQVPGPSEVVGCGFVTREDERHRLVAKLLVRHAAFFVGSEDQM